MADGRIQRRFVVSIALMAVALTSVPASAHSGGLDSSGGHHCRQAGFDSGKCSPLNSYHSHNGSGSGGGSGGASTPAPAAPAPPPDTTAPDAPKLGRPAVDGRTVRVPVTAERGSRLQVATGGKVVQSAAATGDEQDVVVNFDDGNHAIEVTATDSAGNTSVAASFRVTLDTTAPDAPTIDADVATTAGSATTLKIVGERSAAYELEVSGPEAHADRGRLSSGNAEMSWRLPNGEYRAVAHLTDGAGNASAMSEVAFTVTLPGPDAPAVSVTSPPGQSPIVLAISAAGAENALVSIAAEDVSDEQTVALDEDGDGTLEFAAEDGVYGFEAVAVDFQAQRSDAAHLSDVVVKTAAPALALAFVDNLLSTGHFAYELTAEEGSTIRIASETEELLAEFVATGAPQSFSIDVPNGEHGITIAAVDPFGNETVQEFAAEVTEPLGAAGVIVLLILLAMVIAAGVGGQRLWRRLRKAPASTSAPTSPPPPAAAS